ncbi:hypothetical protein Bca4012_081587 [Brassica carinata]
MDIYAILRSATGEFESEAAEKEFVNRCQGKPRVMISVEGYDTCLPEEEIKKKLINHFNSCGEVLAVIIPKDPDHSPDLYRRAFVILLGDGAEEKALQLNGTDIGGWNALVKVEPEEEDEESSRYRSSLINELRNDPKFNRPLGNGQIGLGYTVPAHMIEFANKIDDEIEDKVFAFKKQRGLI